jgi:hypothetical protein
MPRKKTMKRIHMIVLYITGLFGVFALNHTTEAGWHEDTEFRYGIDIPDGWTMQNLDRSPGRMMIALSPDENVAVSVTSVPVDRPLTPKNMVDSFEEGLLTQILSSGRAIKRRTRTINGLTGSYVIYKGAYSGNSGNVRVTVHAFYTARDNTGYFLWWLIPNKLVKQHRAIAERAFASFVVPGAKATAKQKPSPSSKPSIPKGLDCDKAKQNWAKTVRAYYRAKQQGVQENEIQSIRRDMMHAQKSIIGCQIELDGDGN